MSSPTLPYGRQLIEDDDVEAVARVLRSDFLTTGPEVERFEAELAEACGARHAVAVANGTAALHCAYAACGLGPGDEIITSPLTFSATANMALALGARPVFADVDPTTLCLDARAVERALSPRTRAISSVDFAGHPADMDELNALGKRHGLLVVEDAAHAIGSRYRGRPVGSLAPLTTFSFHPVKTITTGEGGAILTDDAQLAQRLRDFRNHGLVREAERLSRNDGPWYYEVQTLGFNYRLSALQCALGRSQLLKLERFVGRRREIVARYRAQLASSGLDFVVERADVQPAWHLFAVQVPGGAAARASVFASLQRRGIAPQVHYIPVNALPLYRDHQRERTPIAAAAAERLISLPLYPAMTDADVDRVIQATREALDELQG